MSDSISRADAIEAIQNAYCKPCKERGDDYNEVRCRACEYDNAIIQIDALPSAEARWIPCSERLPEVGEICLLTVHEYGWNCKEYTRVIIGEYSDNYADHILAWMPLPKPYREESEVGE